MLIHLCVSTKAKAKEQETMNLGGREHWTWRSKKEEREDRADGKYILNKMFLNTWRCVSIGRMLPIMH